MLMAEDESRKMFVVRYLMAALAVLAGVLVWGSAVGYLAWQIAGLAFLAVLAMQALILAHVVLAVARTRRASSRRVPGRRDQLVILPR